MFLNNSKNIRCFMGFLSSNMIYFLFQYGYAEDNLRVLYSSFTRRINLCMHYECYISSSRGQKSKGICLEDRCKMYQVFPIE